MANERKITDIIDQKAFDQFMRLREELKDSQKEFVELAKSVKKFNDEVGRSGSMESMAESISNAEKASMNMANASKKVQQVHQRTAEAQEAVVEATKSRIDAETMNDNLLRKVAGNLDSHIRRQVQLKAELSSVRKEMKEVEKAVVGSAESKRKQTATITKLAKEEAILRQALQQTNLEIRRQTREQIAADGSSDKLAARLDQLRGAYRGLNDEERNNEEIGGKLLTQITQLDAELKELDGKQGVYNRNVGNYASGQAEVLNVLDDLFPSLGSITNAYKEGSDKLSGLVNLVQSYVNGMSSSVAMNNQAASAINKTTVATTGNAKALRILRIALISTGIGAIVVLIGSLIAYLTQAQSGIDRLTRVTRPLSSVFQMLLGVLEGVGKALVDAVTSPRKAWDSFKNYINNTIMPYFVRIMGVFSKLKVLDLEGAKRDFDELIDMASTSAKKVSDRFSEAWSLGKAKDNLMKEIDEIEIDLTRNSANLKRQMEEYNEIAKDSTKSDKERSQAALDATNALNELASKETALIEKKIELQKIEMQMGGEVSRAERLELAKLEAERDDIMAKASRRRSRFTARGNKVTQSMVNEMERQAERERQISQEALEREEALQNNIYELSKERNERLNKLYSDEVANTKLSVDSRLESLELLQNKEIEIIEDVYTQQVLQEEKRMKVIAKLREDGREEEAKMEERILNNNLDRLNEIRLEKTAESNAKMRGNLEKIMADQGMQMRNEAVKQIEESSRAELKVIKESYINREISQEKYEQKRLEIIREGQLAVLKSEIEAIEKIIKANEELGLDVSESYRKLTELRKQLSDSIRDHEIDNLDKTLEHEKMVIEKRKELYNELSGLALDLINSRFEKQLQSLDAEKELMDQDKEDRINAIEQEGLSQEEAAQRKAVVEAQSRSRERQIENEKRRVKQKQARADRLASIANIINNTAQGITSALAMFPPNVPLSLLIGGIGATQLARVMSSPLPKFWRGTSSSPEGPAIVGERGSELMITPDGDVSLTPEGDTLTYLQKGTRIFDANKTKQILASVSLPKQDREAGTSFDIGRLLQASEEQTRKLEKAFKSSQSGQTGTILTGRGIRKYYSRSRNIKNYLSRLL